MSDVKIDVPVKILGGPDDGWGLVVRIPASADRVRLAGIVYRIRLADERWFLVHPSAQGLFW